MTGTMKNKPAKCCCGPCEIDHYATETAFTSDVIRSAVHPQSPYPAWLQAEVKAAVGNTLKLFLAWNEASPGDGLYIEFIPADGAVDGTLKLFRKDATQLGTTMILPCVEADIWHRITACYGPDRKTLTVRFEARDALGVVIFDQCTTADVPADFVAGTKAGYGGTGSIKNYQYDRLWYCGDPPYTEDCHAFGDDWDAYYNLPPRTICHECCLTCDLWEGTFASIDCDWTLTSGDSPTGGVFTTAGWITAKYTIADPTEATVTWTLATTWMDGLAVGDTVEFIYGAYSLVLLFESVTGLGVPVYRATLTSVTGASITATVALFRTLSMCIELSSVGNWLVIANMGSGVSLTGLGTTTPTGDFGLKVTYTGGGTGVTLETVNVVRNGLVQTETDQLVCPGCTTVCTRCIDSQWPAQMIAEIEGLEAWQDISACGVAGLSFDCNSLNAPHYLTATPQLQCVSSIRVYAPSGSGERVVYSDVTAKIIYYNQFPTIWTSASTFYTGIVGHYYLLVTLAQYISASPQPFTWYQYWAKDLTAAYGSDPFNCEFVEEECAWIGAYRTPPSFVIYPSRRYCGGGMALNLTYCDRPFWEFNSVSTVKVTSA